ncbi:DUF1707 and DUF2154 domain-containing protein [Streptomyces verrucosisporus]|uniref:DUF1707 SHOCT-like domain-containing protein n=1 Tax=Streptomyces verrucosisporus TaxID=1695161 RepID=UPI0019D02156|nr:DUF1707 domain-containing protein [Streptomyces verrucosisporus]MBN3929827.1 DUF1707 and DUF2154 domain-containing protein [Streptomyces verrucosisporus]
MTDDLPEMRASDADRERVAEVLREAVAEGRLNMEEFQERLDSVYAARTQGELAPLVRDLPQATTAATPAEPARAGRGWAERFGGSATSRGAVAVMGGFVRKGPWTAPRRFTCFAFWGGGEIDLREAYFEDREVEIRCFAIMGGVNVIVPDEAEVDVRGIGVMGGFDHSAAGRGEPGAPRVAVSGFAFWGGVGVERRRAERRERKRLEGGHGHGHDRRRDDRDD